MKFCHRCGARCLRSYRQVGFDSFWGTPVYVERDRCPNANEWGLPTRHTDREGRWAESADYFGHTDASILAAPSSKQVAQPAELPGE